MNTNQPLRDSSPSESTFTFDKESIQAMYVFILLHRHPSNPIFIVMYRLSYPNMILTLPQAIDEWQNSILFDPKEQIEFPFDPEQQIEFTFPVR